MEKEKREHEAAEIRRKVGWGVGRGAGIFFPTFWRLHQSACISLCAPFK